MASAAGGTSQRLKPGPATIRSLSRKPELEPDIVVSRIFIGHLLRRTAIALPSPAQYPGNGPAYPIKSKHGPIQKPNVAMQQMAKNGRLPEPADARLGAGDPEVPALLAVCHGPRHGATRSHPAPRPGQTPSPIARDGLAAAWDMKKPCVAPSR